MTTKKTTKEEKAVKNMTVEERLREIRVVQKDLDRLGIRLSKASIATNLEYEKLAYRLDSDNEPTENDYHKADKLKAREDALRAEQSRLKVRLNELLEEGENI